MAAHYQRRGIFAHVFNPAVKVVRIRLVFRISRHAGDVFAALAALNVSVPAQYKRIRPYLLEYGLVILFRDHARTGLG